MEDLVLQSPMAVDWSFFGPMLSTALAVCIFEKYLKRLFVAPDPKKDWASDAVEAAIMGLEEVPGKNDLGHTAVVVELSVEYEPNSNRYSIERSVHYANTRPAEPVQLKAVPKPKEEPK